MHLTPGDFIILGIALVFFAIAITEFLASKGSRTIDIIVGTVAFIIFACILLTKLAPLFHWI